MLRLAVDPEGRAKPGPTEELPEIIAAKRAIAAENHLARGCPDPSAYEELARTVAASLQGGRAAMLVPERRRLLIAGAVKSGMRPFEAHLVVASVQEAARHGEIVVDDSRPSMQVEIAANESSAGRWYLVALVVLVVAGLLLVMLVNWTLGSGPTVSRPGAAESGRSRAANR